MRWQAQRIAILRLVAASLVNEKKKKIQRQSVLFTRFELHSVKWGPFPNASYKIDCMLNEIFDSTEEN